MAGDPSVLFVFGQTGKQANGGVKSLLSIVAGLASTRPVLLTNAPSRPVQELADRGVRVLFDERLGLGAGGGAGAALRRAAALNGATARIARREGIDVVHANDLPSLFASALAARALRVPVVWNIRALVGVSGPRWTAGRVLADVVVSLSRDMSDRIARALTGPRWLSLAPVEEIYSVVDTSAVRPLAPAERAARRASLGMADGEIAVGVVAAFRGAKQQVELLAALRRRSSSRVVWHFVGDYEPATDPYAARFAELLAADPALASRVRVRGFRSDVAAYYAALDLVVVPSNDEGLARCMIEAIAAGTPVVSFEVPSAREILEGHRCGRVVPLGDFGALLDAVDALSADPDLRRELGARGRAAAVELFDAKKNVAAYEALYRRLARR